MKIHHHTLSGHSHRVVLFASLLGLTAELVEVDLKSGAHKKPEFLALNPFGQVPVLEDDDVVISDSNAILVYLAKKSGRGDWLPENARGAAAVQRWRSDEHTSELQSLMRISYAVFCLQKTDRLHRQYGRRSKQ